MASLQIALNESPLVEAGTDACCSLDWYICCSLFEPELASLVVTGMIEREHNKYDHLYWVENLTLAAGDRLRIACLEVAGSSDVIRVHTHEQLEEQRIEVTQAEAAGEYDAARAAPRALVRKSCALELVANDGTVRTAEASALATTIVCEGSWTNLRPTQWRLRLWSMPSTQSTPGFWQPITGAAHVTIREA